MCPTSARPGDLAYVLGRRRTPTRRRLSVTVADWARRSGLWAVGFPRYLDILPRRQCKGVGMKLEGKGAIVTGAGSGNWGGRRSLFCPGGRQSRNLGPQPRQAGTGSR